MLHHGIRIPASHAFGHRDDAGVVPPYFSELSIGPLLVLPLVRGQLLLPVSFRGLRSLPVPLEARPGFGLRQGPATGSPAALRLVLMEIRHRHGLRQWSWSEGLDLFGAHERGNPESRSLTA
ncbi:hypothetical protein SHIRM173S_01738 [Streptomyces hirsutus]